MSYPSDAHSYHGSEETEFVLSLKLEFLQALTEIPCHLIVSLLHFHFFLKNTFSIDNKYYEENKFYHETHVELYGLTKK